MYKIIDGKKIAKELKEKIKKKVEKLTTKPGLAVELVGKDPASQVYVGFKHKACKAVGIKSFEYSLDKNTTQEELLKLIDQLNNNPQVHGILVQMPTPKHIDKNVIFKAIAVEKDVDGFHPQNIGKMILFEPCLKACTPRGIMKMMNYYNIDLVGKDVVIIGKSKIVGTPLANMFMNETSTVTVCHSKTKDLKAKTLEADILISAAGKKDLVTKDMVKQGAVVVDVGINKVDGKIYGDVDFENVKDKCSFITPVPGGVGPMTIACLLDNTLIAYKNQMKNN